MIKEINNFFDIELFNENDLEKLLYLSKYNFGEYENVRISALFGDKIIDFYLYEYLKKCNNINFHKAGEYDDFRKKYTNNKNWIKLFDEFKVKEYFDIEENNNFSKDNKSAFFEALVYEIYKHDQNKMGNIINVIIKKVQLLMAKEK